MPNEAYRQVGSDVIAPAGDITILAKTVDIVEARETSRYETEEKFKQSGLTISASNAIVSALQTGQQMADAASNTSDGRMQALAGAAAAFKGYNTYKGLTNAAGNFDAKKAAEITVNISYGTSESESKSSSQSNSAAGSTVAAGNNVTIVATGAGQASNLTARGATLTAGNNVTLLADNNVNLLASQSNASQESSNSSSSSSVGASVGIGATGLSYGVNASTSKGQGNSNGADTTYTNTEVRAGNTASIISGGDTNLIGAVVEANTVKANVGGNLTIESLQDTSTYTSKQSSSSTSVSFNTGSAIPVGGGASASKSSIDSTYASVVQQSGIKAGDGGFQVDVQGNTDLKGAVIASTQAAVDNNKNSFSTGGTLTLSDIQNSAEYKGTAYGISVDVGEQKGKFGVTGVGVGIGSDKGEASSTSSSGISGIAGNTAVRSTDAETGIAKIFDADRVQKEINAQMQITQAFTKEAPKAVGTYADEKYNEAVRNQDQAEIDKWKANGTARVALHALAGAFGGGISGAAGAAASASAANLMNDFQDGIQQTLQDAGMSAGAAKAIAQSLATITAAGIGAAVSGTQGAVFGAVVDANNRQLHPTEIQWIKSNAKRYAEQMGMSEVDAEKALAQQAFRQVQFAAEGGAPSWDVNAQTFLKTAGMKSLPDGGYLFYATPEQRANSAMYFGSVLTNAEFYSLNGLKQPSVSDIEKAAQRDATLRANLGAATKSAIGVAATIALVGLAPTTLSWTLANPIEASSAGIITAETAAAITSGAVTPSSMVNATQLRTVLAFQEAGILNAEGKLTQQALNGKKFIELTEPIKNPSVVAELTKDGSKIEDWGKYTTQSVKMPNGQSLQIHFYENIKTGVIDYFTPDFKVKGIVKP